MREAYYKPSGKVKGSYFLWLFLILLVGIPILSVAYIYALYYVPWVQLAILLTVGCGALLGLVMSHAAKLGKARNPALVLIASLFATVVMKYVQWCVYIPLVQNRAYDYFSYEYGFQLSLGGQLIDALENLIYPLYVFAWMGVINELGVWGISNNGGAINDNVTGVFLAIIWIGELVILAAMAIWVSRARPRFPFSEENEDWYVVGKEDIECDFPADFPSFKTRLEAGNFEELTGMVTAGKTDESAYLRLIFHVPPRLSHVDRDYLTVSQISVDKKNRVKHNDIIKFLSIDVATVATLQEAARLPDSDAAQGASPAFAPDDYDSDRY